MSFALRAFSPEEHDTWRLLFERQAERRAAQLHPMFAEGLERLGFSAERVPELPEINGRLFSRTGWQGVPVKGLEEDAAFFQLLADRCFPIGNFIRDRQDLSYTPAPDVFHDLYGHIPFYANPAYADACARFGEMATRYTHLPQAVVELSRFFWFTFEFGLVETPRGRRIFGAGIASSFAECAYALSAEPEVRPFSVDAICSQDYRIDQLQKVLFVLERPEQLYGSIDAVEARMRRLGPPRAPQGRAAAAG